MIQNLILYLFFMNIVAFSLMGIDKKRAQKGKWRISERSLLSAALLGGALGALLGMTYFRHKTKHNTFSIGLPIILILWIGLIYYIFIKNLIT